MDFIKYMDFIKNVFYKKCFYEFTYQSNPYT